MVGSLRRHVFAAMISLCLTILGCDGIPSGVPRPSTVNGGPDNPAQLASSPGIRAQRVEEGGGGGGGQPLCPVLIPSPSQTCVFVTLDAPADAPNVHLVGTSADGSYDAAVPRNVRFSSSLLLDQSILRGAFLERYTKADLHASVVNGVASVALTLSGPFDQTRTVAVSGSGPVTQSVSETCTPYSGQSFGLKPITTNVTLELPQLGRTRLVFTHMIQCSL